MIYRGCVVRIEKTYKGEIDFVAIKDGKKCFIQVAYLLSSEDVVIEIELVPITSYDDPDDYLSWDETVIDEISVLSEEDKQYAALDFNQKLKLNIDITKFGNSNNLLDREEFESSNEDVIPVDALKFEPIKTSMGYIHGGSIVVDLKK